MRTLASLSRWCFSQRTYTTLVLALYYEAFIFKEAGQTKNLPGFHSQWATVVSLWCSLPNRERLGKMARLFSSALEEQPRSFPQGSFSHQHRSWGSSYGKARLWVWESADEETDSKYICFHMSLLFSVLTAIKTTWNQPHFSFGSSD